MFVRAHIIVSGLVQGVFYRRFVQMNATALELNGWVKNLYDGRVELVTEGERGMIEELIKQLKVGPSNADVKGVGTEWERYTGEFKGFNII